MSTQLPFVALRFRVTLSDAASNALDDLDEDTAVQVLTAVAIIATYDNPLLSPNVRRMEVMRPTTYRLRSGKYRALFRLCDGAICVESIDHRNDSYEA